MVWQALALEVTVVKMVTFYFMTRKHRKRIKMSMAKRKLPNESLMKQMKEIIRQQKKI